MRIHTKKVLRGAILVSVTLVMLWGMSEIVKGNRTLAVACNSNAVNISGSDEDRALCLQDMNDSVKASMTVGYEHYALVDSRDGNTYYVAKLADGNVWMTQNLGLGTTSSTVSLSPNDTDISMSSTFTTLPVAESIVDFDRIDDINYYTVHDGYIEGGNIFIQYGGAGSPRDIVMTMTETQTSPPNAHYRLGNGYPWTVATAQTADYVDPSNQTGINMVPSDSICPAGWKLPSQSDYRTLLEKYDLFVENSGVEGSADISGDLRNIPFLFLRGFPYKIGTEGHYWTSTTSEDNDHYVARVFSLSTNEAGVSYKADELSGVVGAVRCIARSDSDITYTLSYNLNGGSGTIGDNTVSSNRKEIATTVTEVEPTRTHYNFLGWASSDDAMTAEYDGGDGITLGGDKTLYAVWEIVVSDQVVSFEQASVNKTYGDSDFTNAASTTGDGTLSYSSSNTSVADVNSETGKVTINGAGTTVITASATATDYYRAASETYTLTVSKATPTVSFENTTVSKTYLDDNFINLAKATSGGAISYESGDTDVATVDGATGEVTIEGVGTATITATVAATSNYDTASATYTLTVERYAPTIAFANTSVVKTYGDAKFTNAVTTISDGSIAYSSSNTDVATINSATGEVTIMKVGTATITATVSATANYDEASTTYNLTVNKKTSAEPEEVSEIKNGYVTDALSTIALNTLGLVWDNPTEKIKEGNFGYAVKYTENADTTNYTTESFEITVHGVRRVYEVTEGDGETYKQKGDKEIIRFIIDVNHDLFGEGGEVYINGTLLDSQYYTSDAEDDTTVINLTNEYLEALEPGEYEITVFFNDGGVAEADFTVEEADKEEEKEDEEKEDEKEDEEEVVPVPDTGRMNQSNNSTGVGTLIGIAPAGIIASIMIAKYCYAIKRAHRKF
ncbi:Ig-like domain-containing protein [Candidatus Saccharibacteria bacterium]|nr:Ig-like domain-containing protein [Candidatus Saccharibacteria bacterium]